MKRVVPAWVTHPWLNIILISCGDDILPLEGSQRYYISKFRGLGVFCDV